MTGKPGTFQIGLAMAGAISAGAYSSGVVDFLFQALDEWEKAKRSSPDSVPSHNVCIKVITGASAGSITGALGAVALAGGLRPVVAPNQSAPTSRPVQPYLYTVPALYTAWVEMPDMALPPGQHDLLGTEDIDGKQPIASLLNASVLDEIGARALHRVREPVTQPPVFGPLSGGAPVPYVANPLHVYLTVSNLRGVPYRITFQQGGPIAGHGMLNHGDRRHFIIDGIGGTDCQSAWADRDPGSRLSVTTLPQAAADLPPQWHAYIQAALASSAFPIGLAPRQIEGRTEDFENRQWPFPHEAGHAIGPAWPDQYGPPPVQRAFPFVNVDGGMINNEPFEFAHFALMEHGTEANPRDADVADRAVILVDPFPGDPTFLIDDSKLDKSLVGVIKALLPTFINQARFKPTELALALDDNVYSRYLIAPRRADAAGKPEQFAIATGLLGGFGGFIDRSLRDFDYQLGRRNCQQFLRYALTVGDDNALVAGSKDGSVTGWSEAAKANPQFRSPHRKPGENDDYVVVPLIGSAAIEVPLPAWPKVSAARVRTIQDRAIARAKKLVPRLIAEQIGNRFLGWGARAAWTFFGVGAVGDYVQLAIQQDLIRRDQHADWALGSQDLREIVAGLSDAAYDYRTIDGLAAATHIDPALIERTLEELVRQQRVYVARGQASSSGAPGSQKRDAYTLMDRRPGWFARNVGTPFRPPSYDVTG